MKRSKTFYIALLSAVMMLALAACGVGSDSGSNDDSGSGGEESSESTDESSSSETITVTDATGEETQLEETPQNIVVLEWVYAEDLLALGVQPEGMADIEGYKSWVNIEPSLSESVTDVGTRQEPSLEEIAQLEPDLIITSMSRHEGISDELNDIAPTLMFQPYPEEGQGNQYEEMESTFQKIAKAVDKQDQAEQVLSDLEESYSELETQLTESGMDGTEILLSQAFSSNETATLRLFTDNSMVMQILNKIGLNNAFDGSDFESYGYVSGTVEDLEPYQDAHFMHITQEDDNVFENQLNGNPVWENLNFVQEDRLYALPGDTWTFGGPLAAEVFAEEAVEALTAQ
ncbi:ABC transporter substrate-binding protein [Salibacterium qingdaonense]|uniref:Iron complex transport system substrate-binding protein n=1 Tax=Salibacterium qingdaonense TaxID=266892 RepID=A0A1I4MMN3_9BACI|nr:iron-siderophore ABC transporter substrate-binding protein [Salibacterium qingdaonense]SFM04343.1 iron complex transport system substrate-binding protein [Salibacterium qingdaonense]